jgi:hypothetical protein
MYGGVFVGGTAYPSIWNEGEIACIVFSFDCQMMYSADAHQEVARFSDPYPGEPIEKGCNGGRFH